MKLVQSSGRAIFYDDFDGDRVYKANAPRTEPSWVVRQASGSYVRHFRIGGQETYDAAGRWTGVTDRHGNTTVLERDTEGHLTRVVDPGGRYLSLEWVGGHIVSLSGPLGELAAYEYYPNGWLRGVTYPDGSGFAYTYDVRGQLLTVRDHSGRPVETHAYQDGKAITSEIADGQERLTFSYGADRTTMTDARGNATVYEHGLVAGMIQTKSISGVCGGCGGGTSASYTFDAKGLIASRTDALGGRRCSRTTRAGTSRCGRMPGGRQTHYTYDAQDRLTSVTAANGAVRTIVQGSAGPTRITDTLSQTETAVVEMTYSAQGRLATVTDPLGRTTTFQYDAEGDLVAVIAPTGTLTYTHDGMGRLTSVTDLFGAERGFRLRRCRASGERDAPAGWGDDDVRV